MIQRWAVHRYKITFIVNYTNSLLCLRINWANITHKTALKIAQATLSEVLYAIAQAYIIFHDLFHVSTLIQNFVLIDEI